MTLPVVSSYHPDYARLTAYLAACEEQQITLTFAQLEQAILRAPLPYSGVHESWPLGQTVGMKAYSKDLRIRVLDAVARGSTQLEVAEQYLVSLRTIKRWRQRRRVTGNLATSPRPGPPAVKMGPLRAGLLSQLEAHPAATLAEHCALWAESQGSEVSTATMSRVITGLGWTRKKGR